MPAKPERRSPLSEPPVRRAGERAQNEVFEKRFAPWFAYAGGSIVLVVAAVGAWIAHLLQYPSFHWVMTIVGIFMCGWTAWKIRGDWDIARTMLLGAAGERAVGDILDDLRRERGYHVIHDLPILRAGKEVANIDHVLIGPAGVLVIETKTCMKPPKGRTATVTFDGKRVLVDGHAPDRDPITQVRRNAADVRNMIRDAFGAQEADKVPVRPVLLFPGWDVREMSGVDCWVLNPKRLFAWIKTEESMHKSNCMTEQLARTLRSALENAVNPAQI